jgi:putative tributyrin esterase
VWRGPWRCCVAAALAFWPSAAHGAPASTVLRMETEAPSVGARSRTVRVYLPPSYDRPDAASRRYPVVYMLHGWPGSDGNLLTMGHARETADSLIARGAMPEVIMVFPNGDGAGTLGRSYWLNSYDGRKRVADYVTRDLIAWVDGHFRTIRAPSGRGLIGISEGGDAALNLAFKHPDLYSACGGHSADYLLTEAFGTRGFLGPDPGAQRILEDNSPTLYVDRIVPQLRKQTIYIDCGTGDESIENSRRLHQKLQALGVPHVYREFPGSHTWAYWSAHLRESLLTVAGALH